MAREDASGFRVMFSGLREREIKKGNKRRGNREGFLEEEMARRQGMPHGEPPKH
ncbi:hypothetical protein BHE74_00011331 [Ensete ventricosum]|nr:hypothetical protein BHE74_00011331 [Ensete ventricosum]